MIFNSGYIVLCWGLFSLLAGPGSRLTFQSLWPTHQTQGITSPGFYTLKKKIDLNRILFICQIYISLVTVFPGQAGEQLFLNNFRYHGAGRPGKVSRSQLGHSGFSQTPAVEELCLAAVMHTQRKQLYNKCTHKRSMPLVDLQFMCTS